MYTAQRGALTTFPRWYAMSKSMGKSPRREDWWKLKFSTRKDSGNSLSNGICPYQIALDIFKLLVGLLAIKPKCQLRHAKHGFTTI